MISMKLNEVLLSAAINFAAFLFFSLSLAVPSGYSYGAVFLTLLAVVCIFSSPSIKSLAVETKILLVSLIATGLMWSVSFGVSWSHTGFAYGVKYALAACCLWVLSRKNYISPQAVVWGVATGAVGALGVAVYQYMALHLDKASGFTNAIQFGGIAMYMGMATWGVALLGGWRRNQILILGLCGSCGVLASLLSESRGGWVVAPMLFVAILAMAWHYCNKRVASLAMLGMLIGGVMLVLPAYKKFEQRAALAVHEAQMYSAEPQKYAETSIGQRLEQWRLALRLIEERPFTGWGVEGYAHAKQAMVDKGAAHPSVMEYGHAHNEILDMWVKRGLAGLIILLFFYAAPLYVFWPTHARLARVTEELRPRLLALRAAAALLPLAYFGFGWTQVFFAHNSGHMFYIFSLVIFGAAVRSMEMATAKTSGN